VAFWAKSLQVEVNWGLTIRNCLFIRIPLADNNTFEAERTRDIPIRVLLNDYLTTFHAFTVHKSDVLVKRASGSF